MHYFFCVLLVPSVRACFIFPVCCAQVLFNKKTEQLLGVHIIGLHAADLIQECANAMMAGTTVRQLAMMVRTNNMHLLLHDNDLPLDLLLCVPVLIVVRKFSCRPVP